MPQPACVAVVHCQRFTMADVHSGDQINQLQLISPLDIPEEDHAEEEVEFCVYEEESIDDPNTEKDVKNGPLYQAVYHITTVYQKPAAVEPTCSQLATAEKLLAGHLDSLTEERS